MDRREAFVRLGGAAAILAAYAAAFYLTRQRTPEKPLPTPTPIVRTEPRLTPPPPSTTEITVAFPSTTVSPIVPMPKPAVPNHEEGTFLPIVDGLKRLLTGTEQISIDKKSFEEFMREKGYEMDVRELPRPQNGKVKPGEDLRTRVLPTILPTTDENIKILEKKHWLPGNAEVLITYVVILTKNDGSRTEVWMARFDKQANRMVFNAIEFRYKEGDEEKREIFIEQG